jgi:dihydroorotase
VAFYQGKVAAVEDELNAEPGRDTVRAIDASDRIVTPGLVDLHVHVGRGTGYLSLDPDCAFISGTPTNVDAGTYGALNFASFRHLTQDCRARLYAFLNISALGLTDRPELEVIEYGNVERAVETCQRNHDLIKGIKVRLAREALGTTNPMEALSLAKEAASKAGLPLLVHGIKIDEIDLLKGIKLGDVLAELRKGDIYTHTYAWHSGIVDSQGKVIPEAREAQERGVIYDVGHGSGSFYWLVAETCLNAGVGPGTLSTDLHASSYMGPAYDLATIMSKYLLLGCSLDDVVEMATLAPAKAVGMEESIGTLRVGAEADATILDLQRGEFQFYDIFGCLRQGHRTLTPTLTVCRGTAYLANSWRAARWTWPPRWPSLPRRFC